MFKAILVGGVIASVAVYWLCGAFIALAMHLFPINLQNTSVGYQDSSDVQLVGGVQQATPSRLQNSDNVMGEN